MEREFEQLSNDVIISSNGEYFTRVLSAESFTSKFYNEEYKYELSFRNVEINLLQKGSFTKGILLTVSSDNESDEATLFISILNMGYYGTFISNWH